MILNTKPQEHHANREIAEQKKKHTPSTQLSHCSTELETKYKNIGLGLVFSLFILLFSFFPLRWDFYSILKTDERLRHFPGSEQ